MWTLTTREVYWRLQAIGNRTNKKTYEHRSFLASLFGMKLEGPSPYEKDSLPSKELDQDTQKSIEAAKQAAFDRIRARSGGQ